MNDIVDARAHKRLDALEHTVSGLKSELEKNTALTQTIATNTTELVALVTGAKGFRNFILWVGPPLAAISAVIVWIYAIIVWIKGH